MNEAKNRPCGGSYRDAGDSGLSVSSWVVANSSGPFSTITGSIQHGYSDLSIRLLARGRDEAASGSHSLDRCDGTTAICSDGKPWLSLGGIQLRNGRHQLVH